MAQLNDLIVNGYTRFLNSAYGNLNGSATSALCAANAATAVKAADSDKLGGTAAASFALKTGAYTASTQLSAYSAVVAGSAPVGSHTISSHSDSANFFSGNSAKSACSATSAKNAGTADNALKVYHSAWNANSARAVAFTETASGYSQIGTAADFTYNPSTKLLSVVSASATNVRGVTVSATNVTAATTIRGTNISGTNISGAAKTSTIDNLIGSSQSGYKALTALSALSGIKSFNTINASSGTGTVTAITAGTSGDSWNLKVAGVMSITADTATKTITLSSRDNTGTDTKVTQNRLTTNNDFPIILKYNETTVNVTNTVNFNEGFTYNPSTSSVKIGTDNLLLDNDASANLIVGMSNTAYGSCNAIIGAANYISSYAGFIEGHQSSAIGTNAIILGAGNLAYTTTEAGFSNNIAIGMGCSTYGVIGTNITLGFGDYCNAYDQQFGNLVVNSYNSAMQMSHSFAGGLSSRVETYKGTDPQTINNITESELRPTFAFGYNVSAKGGAVVFGYNNLGVGENSGYLGKAYSYSTAGSSVSNIVSSNMTAGYNWFVTTTSGGEGGPFIVGSYNRGYNPGTFVAGISSNGIAPASFVACKGNIAVGYAQTVIGKYNYPENAVFTIGAGQSDSDRRNAFSLVADYANAKFFLGRSSDGDADTSWVTNYPEVYVGNTLKLYGSLLTMGCISSQNGMESSGHIVLRNSVSVMADSGDIYTNYGDIKTYEGNIYIGKGALSCWKANADSASIVLRSSGVAQAGNYFNDFSATVNGIIFSYNNPGGSYGPSSASWKNIIDTVNSVTGYFTGSSAKSAVITEKVDITTNTTAGNIYLTMNKGNGHIIQNPNFTVNITGGTLYATNINGNLTAGSANSALTSKSALSAGSATTGLKTFWSKAGDTVDENRVIALTYAGYTGTQSTGGEYYESIAYDTACTFNSKTNTLKSENLSSTNITATYGYSTNYTIDVMNSTGLINGYSLNGSCDYWGDETSNIITTWNAPTVHYISNRSSATCTYTIHCSALYKSYQNYTFWSYAPNHTIFIMTDSSANRIIKFEKFPYKTTAYVCKYRQTGTITGASFASASIAANADFSIVLNCHAGGTDSNSQICCRGRIMNFMLTPNAGNIVSGLRLYAMVD